MHSYKTLTCWKNDYSCYLETRQLKGSVCEYCMYNMYIHKLNNICKHISASSKVLPSCTEMIPGIFVSLGNVVKQKKNSPYEIAFLRHLLHR